MTEAELYVAMRAAAQREMRAFRDAEMVDHVANPNAKRGGRKGKRELRLEDYRACAEEGLSKSDTAKRLGVSSEAARHFTKKHGIVFRDGRRKA
jgi:hypothetical protein